MRRPPLTPLQEVQVALRDLLLDARKSLDARGYRFFVEFVCTAIAIEAARIADWTQSGDEDGTA